MSLIGPLQWATAPGITWNPSDAGPYVTLSGGNLVATIGNFASLVRCTVGKSTGKWYWEIVPSGFTTNADIGIAKHSTPVNQIVGSDNNSYGYVTFGSNADRYYNGVLSFYTGATTYAPGDVVGVALDLVANQITMYKNGVSQGIMYTGITGMFYPAVSNFLNQPIVYTAHFDAGSFVYAPPAGFGPLTV